MQGASRRKERTVSGSDDPTLVVAIISHSNRTDLLQALDSLVDDELRTELKVVVLDNASSDESAEAIKAAYSTVTVIEQPYRAGFGANHNTIIRSTHSAYVLLLNDDAKVAKGTIDALVDLMDANPRVAAAGPRVRRRDGKEVESAWRFPSLLAVTLFALTAGRYRSAQSRVEHPRHVDQLSGCALMLRRSALDDVGLFDEDFYMYGEDADLCMRLQAAGWESWIQPSATVYHAGGSSSAGLAPARVVEEWRSRQRFWRKHYGAVTAIICGILRGLPYGVAGLVLGAVRPLPVRRLSQLRQRGGLLRWHARNAWFGPAGPGLREAAEEWNKTHGCALRPEKPGSASLPRA